MLKECWIKLDYYPLSSSEIEIEYVFTLHFGYHWYFISGISKNRNEENRYIASVTLEQAHNAGEHYEHSDTEQMLYIYFLSFVC